MPYIFDTSLDCTRYKQAMCVIDYMILGRLHFDFMVQFWHGALQALWPIFWIEWLVMHCIEIHFLGKILLTQSVKVCLEPDEFSYMTHSSMDYFFNTTSDYLIVILLKACSSIGSMCSRAISVPGLIWSPFAVFTKLEYVLYALAVWYEICRTMLVREKFRKFVNHMYTRIFGSQENTTVPPVTTATTTVPPVTTTSTASQPVNMQTRNTMYMDVMQDYDQGNANTATQRTQHKDDVQTPPNNETDNSSTTHNAPMSNFMIYTIMLLPVLLVLIEYTRSWWQDTASQTKATHEFSGGKDPMRDENILGIF